MGGAEQIIQEYQDLREKIYDSIFTKLNQPQREVISTGKGAVLCLAGAGSGKTMAMIYRILHLYLFGPQFVKEVCPPCQIEEADLQKLRDCLKESCPQFSPEIIDLLRVGGVSPAKILAITFTNKAAEEMKIRLNELGGVWSKSMWVMTFHAVCVRILQREITHLGYTSNFAIYDSQDQLVVLREICRQLNLGEKEFAPRKIQHVISRYKCQLQTAAQALKSSTSFLEKKYLEVYQLYQNRLKENNALDFDDLIMLTVRLFREQPLVLARYQKRFQYIMVDEYQDTNHAQYVLINSLAQKHRNLCVVGDDDQSIYGFRAADIRNILDFEKDYPEARVIKLEQNYRSTQLILEAANEVIAHNRGRKVKKLWTENPTGESILCFTATDEADEAAFLVEKLRELKKEGVNFGDCAVLMRTNAQSRTPEEWFIRTGIPYKLIGGVKFYERKEIKDILAYLKVLVNPCDQVSLKRIINEPRRGIGDVTFQKIVDYSWQENVSIMQAVEEGAGLVGKTAQAVQVFGNLMTSFRQAMSKLTVTELTSKILEDTGYWRGLYKEKSQEAENRLENLDEFLTKTTEYDYFAEENSLGDFLNQVALVTDLDNLSEKEEAVVLMTMHSAKGLEFPYVFLIGLEEGIFPHYRACDSTAELEEERRLCYVAMTRAQKRLYLLNAEKRWLYGYRSAKEPSRFLGEVPAQLCEHYHRPRLFETSPAYEVKKTGSVSRGQAFILGDKVLHQKWGAGVIVSTKGKGSEIELAIAFPDVGIKSVLAKYAPLRKIE